MTRRFRNSAILLLALASTSPVLARKPDRAPPPDPTQDPVMITAGFLNGHPDLRFRLLALERREAGKQQEAFGFFQRASFYADKPSQGMVAEMLWNGTGTPQDRAAAYAWMDLAAERGYQGFLDLRERYWAALDDNERQRAVVLGQDIYARYGDQAALPRIANAIRRERRSLTGSRTGFTGNLKINIPSPAGGVEQIDGSKFYDERYWDPEQYLAWHDAIWMKPLIATVNVGDAQQVEASRPTRIPAVSPISDAPEPDLGDEMPKIDVDGKRP